MGMKNIKIRTVKAMNLDNIYHEGAEAFHDGLQKDDCPYTFDTHEYHSWIEGYEYAREHE